jgi:dienelactone hydrolase
MRLVFMLRFLAFLLVSCAAFALEPLRDREAMLVDWQRILGPMPKTKAPLKLEVVSEEKMPEFTRQYVRYQITDGVWTDGYLLIPPLAEGKKTAGVVVFHSTVKVQAQLVAGIDQSVPDKMQGVHMAKLGYVALCPRNFLFNEGADLKGNTVKVLKDWPTGMARMLWDGIRALDVLASLPQVEANRLGCIGHSLGAKEALYLAAFDERVKVAVSSEGGVGLSMSNWEADWYLGPQIKAPGFKHDHHEMLALIAPRAYLWIGGDSADTDAGLDYLKAAQPVFSKAGVPGQLQFFNHRLGHAYPPVAREKNDAFLVKQLGK